MVSNDWRLADHLWDDIFKSKEEVLHSLIDYVYIESLAFDSVSDILDGDVPTSELTPPHSLWKQWASGQVVFTPEYGVEHHAAALAFVGRVTDVEHKL